MSAPRGTLDSSIFGRAETGIRQAVHLPEHYIEDANHAARQLRSILNAAGNQFGSTTDPRTIELVGRAVKKAMRYEAPPPKDGLPVFVSMFAARLAKGGGFDGTQRLESADLCGYIATTNLAHIKI